MKKYCVMPWVGLEINNNGGFRPCCVYSDRLEDSEGKKYNINTHTLEEYMNSDSLRKLRQDLLDGKAPKGCDKCYREEELNINSMRVRKNRIFPQVFENSDPGNLSTIDLKLSNLCNQKCVICNANASSMLAAENKEILPEENNNYDYKLFNWYKIEDKWDQLKEQTQSTVHYDFYGGEPWLIKKQWEFIEHLIETGKSEYVSLNYATNGSIHEDKFFEEYFSKFKRVTILYSADGIEDTFEYNRYPGKWDLYKENILKAKEYCDKKTIDWIAVAYTVSAYSIHNVIDSLNFYKKHEIPVWFNLVNEPFHRPGLLSSDIKKQIIDNIKNNWQDDYFLVDNNINPDFFEAELNNEIEEKWKQVFIDRTNIRDLYRKNSLIDIIKLQGIDHFMQGNDYEQV